MSDVMAGYDEDLFLWSQQQAAALRDAHRRGANLPVDWENVAEEIESLGKRDRRQLTSRIGTIMEHLLKLESSAAVGPRNGWTATVLRERSEVEAILEDSPSLRRDVPDAIARSAPKIAKLVVVALQGHGEHLEWLDLCRRATAYKPEEVLGDWLPPTPPGV